MACPLIVRYGALTRELLVRFVLGGIVVSAFAALGEVFKPKRFGGMFSAAPSLAIATLAMAFASHGASYAVSEARSMIAGAIAMLVQCAACVVTGKIAVLPMWLSALAGWFVWFAVAFTLWGLGVASGVLR